MKPNLGPLAGEAWTRTEQFTCTFSSSTSWTFPVDFFFLMISLLVCYRQSVEMPVYYLPSHTDSHLRTQTAVTVRREAEGLSFFVVVPTLPCHFLVSVWRFKSRQELGKKSDSSSSPTIHMSLLISHDLLHCSGQLRGSLTWRSYKTFLLSSLML